MESTLLAPRRIRLAARPPRILSERDCGIPAAGTHVEHAGALSNAGGLVNA